MRPIIAATLIAVSARGIPAQSAVTLPSFEVSTIKPSSPDADGRSFRFAGVRRFTANNHTLKECIGFAYNLTPGLMSGGPAWADTDRYDIVGETPGEGRLPNEQTILMFQALLADRFKLKFHREQKELSVYMLVVGKNGPTMKETASPDRDPGLIIQRSRRAATLPARSATMAQFSSLLQRVVLDRPVIDKTGLSARYDFDLEWSTDGTQLGGVDSAAVDADKTPDLFTAIKRLGLRLESTKAGVQGLVIDRAEKPDAN